MARTLNPRQLKFVERYLASGNATRSYIAAGYKARGHAAEVSAERLLRNVEVVKIIEAARLKAAKSRDLTAEYVLDRMWLEAERVGEGSSHAARVKALELLGRPFGLFPSKIEHSGPNGGPIRMNVSRLSDADLNTIETILVRAEEGASDELGGSVENGARA